MPLSFIIAHVSDGIKLKHEQIPAEKIFKCLAEKNGVKPHVPCGLIPEAFEELRKSITDMLTSSNEIIVLLTLHSLWCRADRASR